MTRLTLSRDGGRGSYTLVGEDGAARGSLAVDRRLRHGAAVTAAGSVAVHSSGRRRHLTCAGDERAPVLRLDPPAATVPGLGAARWDVGRDRRQYVGALTADGVSVRLTVPAGGHGPVQIEAEGDWPGRDLLVLTAAFALLARRRSDTILTAVLVSMATGGSGR